MIRLLTKIGWIVSGIMLTLASGTGAGAASTPAAAWTAEGSLAGARLGAAMTATGDVNGDGYADVAAGAPDAGGEGRVVVYLGSASGPAATPALTLEGGQAGSRFGAALALADVNGDGFADLIVGAPDYDGALADEGRLQVFMGSQAGLAATPARAIDGGQAGARLGAAVAAVGDVNGDGYGDVAAGAPDYDGTLADEGQARLYLGAAAGLGATAAWTAEGGQAGARLGAALAGAGDVNGDGRGDLLAGAPLYDTVAGGADAGRALLFSGFSSNAPAWVCDGDQAGEQLGASVATAGDTNGDGYADVSVGSPLYDNGAADAGRARLFAGSASGLAAAAAWSTEGGAAGERLGSAVAPAGDLNGDGHADLAIGSAGYGSGQAGEGRVQVFYGAAAGVSATAAWAVESNQAGAALGQAMAPGDVNGDGFGDLLTGAPNYDNGLADRGRVTLYLGARQLPSATPAWMTEADQAGALHGAAVAWVGDVNGDGYGDALVGTPNYDNGQTDEGRVVLYLGTSAGLSTTAAWSAEGNQSSAQFGAAVAGAGDVNGDGYADVLIGAPFYNGGQSSEGRVSLYLGSASGLAAAPAWTYESNQPFAQLGSAVAGAGDVNGDGYADVLAGAPLFAGGQASEGRALLFLGTAAGLAATPAWTAESDQMNAQFGRAVAGAGDVNGDGFSDVIVGAPLYDGTLTDEGRSYVYLGSASGLAASAVWTVDGRQAGAQCGAAVGAAGDVNGDGFADIAVGAPYHDNGQTDEGRAYVYLGSASGVAATAAWSAESNQAGAQFGAALAAGDANGDGFGDLALGAPNYDASGRIDAGRASLYLGSAFGLGAASGWTADGGQTSALFGRALAGVGDAGGDGFCDLLIGVPQYDNGQTNEGRVLVYQGGGDAAGGMPARPRQARLHSAAPIAPLGLADDPLAFRVGMLGRSPLGRAKLCLEVEVKPLGQLLDGTGIRQATEWLDSGLAGADLLTSVSIPLDTPATAFHWRARVRYSPAESPLQEHGRWFGIPGGGWQQASLRMPLRGPAILQQPRSLTVFPGNSATFKVGATGPGALTYQWRKNGASLSDGGRIAGAQTAELTITGAQTSDAATYTCVVNNGAGAVESDPATLTVIAHLLADAAAPGPVHDGLSWETAYPTPQEAIDRAAATGVGEVWVARGRYVGAVAMRGGVAVYGGFEGFAGARESALAQRDWAANPTILDGGGAARHVVLFDRVGNATLDGFGVTGGNAADWSGANPHGGGIAALAAGPGLTLRNLSVYGNRALASGAGLYAVDSALRVEACEFRANTAGDGGGGVALEGGAVVLAGCRIHENTAQGFSGGGGVLLLEPGSPVLEGCLIAANASEGMGGGVACWNGAAPALRGCRIGGNVSRNGRGGGLAAIYGAAPVLTNCVLSGNRAGDSGGALDSSWEAWPTLVNCTVSGNGAGGSGGGLALASPAVVTNTIFDGNGNYAIAVLDSSVATTLTACLFHGNPAGDYLDIIGNRLNGAGAINLAVPGARQNLSGDPMFVMNGPGAATGTLTAAPAYDAASGRSLLTDGAAGYTPGALAGRLLAAGSGERRQWLIVDNTTTTLRVAGDARGELASGAAYRIADYHLLDGSAAIDRGNLSLAPAGDLEGNVRPGADGLVDMGAYESPADFVPAADGNPPYSRVLELSSFTSATTFAVPFIASDAESGIASVRLAYRCNGGAWTMLDPPVAASPFTFTATQGDGLYEFHALATDYGGNVEPAKSEPEASIHVITSFSGSRVYVDLAAPGPRTGLDWSHALNDVAAAVKVAETFGAGEVWVARGRYVGAVAMRDGVAVYGGFEGFAGARESALAQRDWAANPTILDGGGAARHVVLFDRVGNATLDGFSVTGGNAADWSGANPHGGGIAALAAGPGLTLRNLSVYGNRALASGAGLYAVDSALRVEACEFRANTAGDGGGGVALEGGAVVLAGCRIHENTAQGFSGGGGVLLLEPGSPVLEGCLIAANASEGMGGGVACWNGAAPALRGCRIGGNVSRNGRGGGLAAIYGAAPALTNCVLSGNRAGDSGGALDSSWEAWPTLVNCTVSGNGARGSGGGLALHGPAVVTNTIFDGNDNYAIAELDSSVATTLTACLFHANPAGDYLDKNAQILTGGAAIDAGLAAASLNRDGDPGYLMNGALATTGTLTAAPAYDAASGRSLLTDGAAGYTPGALAGRLLAAGSGERRQWLIVDNTTTTLRVAGDARGSLAFGAAYRIADYHLLDGSAAIDRGTAQNAPSTDIDGGARPVDIPGLGNDAPASTFDIGAHETGIVPLHVVSPYGSPVPGAGDHGFIAYSVVTASQGGTVAGPAGVRHQPAGWTRVGSAPASGATSGTTFVIDRETTLTWRWQTQYLLTATASPAEGGRVTLADGITTASGTWHNAGATVQLRAVAGAGYVFDAWSGDASGTANPLGLAMDAPKTVTASFTLLPVITLDPVSQTVDPGAPTSFTVAAIGTPPLEYQWRRNGVPLGDGGTISGSNTPTLLIGAAAESDQGSYDCVVRNAAGQAVSRAAALNVNDPPSIVLSPLGQAAAQGQTVTFTVFALGSEPLHYQWRKNGVALADGGRVSGVTSSTLTLALVDSTDDGDYDVVVSNWLGQATSDAATLRVYIPPAITRQPVGLVLDPGQPATFDLEATGTLPLAYQWRRNGVPLSDGGTLTGATSSTLSISAAAESDEGGYDCVVTNIVGHAVSVVATLSVNDPPVILTQPAGLLLDPGQTAVFDVTVTGTLPLAYQWFKGTTPLADGGRVSGSTSSTLTITGVATPDAGYYHVVITNTAGSATSDDARLRVNPTLTVVSPFGAPIPPVGANVFTTETLVAASVPVPDIEITTGTRQHLAGWTGTGSVPPLGTASATTFTLDQDSTLTWRWRRQYTVNTPVVPTTPLRGGHVEVAAVQDGTTASISQDAFWADAGSTVTLRAVAATGFGFHSWRLPDGSVSTSQTVSLNVTSSTTLWAVFSPVFAVRAVPPGVPADAAIPAIDSDTSCTYLSQVTATRTNPYMVDASTRYLGTTWTLTGSAYRDTSSSLDRVVIPAIDQPTTLTWHYDRQFLQRTQAQPGKGGTVTMDDPDGWVTEGTTVSLTATPNPGYAFFSWAAFIEGSILSSRDPNLSFSVKGPGSIHAFFHPLLTVASDPTPPGTPPATPPVGSVTPQWFDAITTATVQSPFIPTPGIRFICTGWDATGQEDGNVISGTGNTASFRMDQPRRLVWHWRSEYYLDAQARPVGAGSVVLVHPGHPDDGQPAAGWYDLGTVLTLRRTTNSGFTFLNWGGDVSGTALTVGVTIDGPKRAYAYHRPVTQLPFGQGDHATLLGQYGGASNMTSMDGKYAYVGEGSKLTVLDMTLPGEPLPTGQIVLKGVIQGMTHANNLLYVASGTGGLAIVRLNEHGVPELVGQCTTPGFATQVAVSGFTAFVAGGATGGVVAVDAYDPANPVITGSDKAHGAAWGVAAVGNTVYVASSNGVQVYGYRAEPGLYGEVIGTFTWTGQFNTGETTSAVRIVDGRAYVASNTQGLRVWDVRVPTAPTGPVSSFNLPGTTSDVATTGTLACVATSGGVSIIDTSSTTPVLLGSYSRPGFNQKVSVAGHILSLSDSYSGLLLLDISNPANPTPLSGYNTYCVRNVASGGYSIGLEVKNGRVYLPDYDRGLAIVDVGDPSYPVLLGRYKDAAGNAARDVAVDDSNVAYVADSQFGVRKIDVSNPAAPRLLASYLMKANSIAIAGGTGFATSEQGGLFALDLASMGRLASRALPGASTSRGIALDGTYLYTADWGSGIHVTNVATPSAPLPHASFATYGQAAGVAVWNGKIFAADGSNGLMVFSTVGEFSRVHYPLASGTFAYAVAAGADGRLFVAAGVGGLWVLDVTDPSGVPRYLGSIAIPGGAYGVAVNGDVAYVASGEGGLCIVRCDPIPPPSGSLRPRKTGVRDWMLYDR